MSSGSPTPSALHINGSAAKDALSYGSCRGHSKTATASIDPTEVSIPGFPQPSLAVGTGVNTGEAPNLAQPRFGIFGVRNLLYRHYIDLPIYSVGLVDIGLFVRLWNGRYR